MFRSLNHFFIFFIFGLAFSVKAQTLEEFSKSLEWINYLYMKDGKSLILGDRYFLSPKGSESPYDELRASKEAFEQNKKDKEGYYYQCLFPFRYKLLKPFLSQLIEEKDCREFHEWKQGIDIGEVYIVFSSAYPNNPASMFGHTYLRFDREKRAQIDSSQELLGYAVSFQALTNSQDNPLLYTLKGLVGGYESYLEIKPNYVNIGIYNSGESRDLWEFQLNLTKLEREDLRDHIWELSHSGAFKYYFFDENCSTHLLYLLEVIKPNIDFKSTDELFVVPQFSLREVIYRTGKPRASWRPSLKKQVLHSYNHLDEKRKSEFFEVKSDIKKLEKLKDPYLLDTVNLYWKFKNYQEKTKLGESRKKLMHQGLVSRSKISSMNNPTRPFLMEEDEDPVLGHKMSHISLGGGEKYSKFRFRYGFHDFFDFEQGFDQSSYIKFMDINFYTQGKNETWDIDIIDILSLQSFNSLFFPISWRVNTKYKKAFKRDLFFLSGGGGLSKKIENMNFYSLISLSLISEATESKAKTYLDTGFKYKISSTTQFTGGVITDSINSASTGQARFSYNHGDWISSLVYSNQYFEDQISFELGYYF